jgi:hypothetical protein
VDKVKLDEYLHAATGPDTWPAADRVRRALKSMTSEERKRAQELYHAWLQRRRQAGIKERCRWYPIN